MQNLFKNLGLNKKESKIFLKLLELGAVPVSILAKYSGIPRSSMYVVIERLKKEKLIEEFPRMGIKYIKCIPVEDLKNVLLHKEQEVQNTINLLNENFSTLKGLENRLSITPKTRIFEGKDEIKRIYDEVLKEKHFNAFFNPHLVKIIMPEYHFLIPETLRQNKGTAKEILVNCPDAYEYKNKFNSKKHQIKILTKGISFLSDTIITNEKIFMISYGEDEIAAVEIWNKALAETQNTLFTFMWNSCK